YKSPGNKNNRHHIREHVKRIESRHRAIVLEFGMSARGHLTRSCQIIKPNMAIITMVGTSHIGNLGGSLSNLIRAKSELIKHMQQRGTLFLNADDKNSKQLLSKNFHGRIIKIGINNQANYRATHVAYSKGGMTFRVELDGNACNFFIPIYGKHNVYNAMFAIAVAHTLGFSPEKIKAGLRSYERPNRRLRIYSLKMGIKLIDDTFNANPNSVKAALDVLTTISKHKCVAVLGSMGELGTYSQKGHVNVGIYAASKNNLNHIFTYGEKARQIARAAINAGFPRHRIIQSIDRKTLHDHLKRNIQPGSTILVKGSNSMGMNKTVSFIKSLY
ncbi:MAG: UDP-N-acetylmuramoyl-tripeptide--D-alanyl-D-alanine ligase, partial [Syntrophomonas sp.]